MSTTADDRIIAALIENDRIEIRNLDDLMRAVEASRAKEKVLVLLGANEHRHTVAPSTAESQEVTAEKRRAAFESAFGSWKDLVDAEELERNIREGRSSRPRGWPDSHFDDSTNE